MKTTGITTGLTLGALMLFSTPAAADCACFCVDGSLKTLCSTVEEAQGNPALCNLYGFDCQEDTRENPGASYEAPEGAIDCRDRRVYDPLQGKFTTIKACDVLSAG